MSESGKDHTETMSWIVEDEAAGIEVEEAIAHTSLRPTAFDNYVGQHLSLIHI